MTLYGATAAVPHSGLPTQTKSSSSQPTYKTGLLIIMAE